MKSRGRDIALLVLAVAVVAGAALGGYAVLRARADAAPPVRQVLAPVELPTATPAPSSSPEPQYERWTVGVARRPVTVLKRPSSDAAEVVTMGKTTNDYPTVFLVDDIREIDGVPWYKVWVAASPNGTQGWVKDGQLAFYTTASKIVVDLSERTLTVYRRGTLEGAFPVAVGRPGLATPTGTYFVTMKLRPPDPGGAYGVLALGTSAFQPKLSDWPGGGVVGIHGTNEPWLIGKAISHGCIRMKNSAIVRVGKLVPTGSPVFIQK
jgi:lipoprotein-anchoring transpeptidase ErfK/SrfK